MSVIDDNEDNIENSEETKDSANVQTQKEITPTEDSDLLDDLPLNEIFSDVSSSSGLGSTEKLSAVEKLDKFRDVDIATDIIDADETPSTSVTNNIQSHKIASTTPQKKRAKISDSNDEDYVPTETADEDDVDIDPGPANDDNSDVSGPKKGAKKQKFTDNFFNIEKRKELHKEAASVDKYEFLRDVRDAKQRRPGEPGYDKSTLYIPQKDWVKLTAFDKQFWEVKSKHFDTVVFFRKGKFYELYEGDAEIGQRELGLRLTARQGMRMVGVPVMTLMDWAGKLLSKGYKVARVDEMEMGEHSILRRELTRIYTPGTLMEEGLLGGPSAVYLLSVAESAPISTSSSSAPRYGVCLVDCAAGEVAVGEFEDDSHRTGFETLLVQRHPREILVAQAPDARAPSGATAALLRSAASTADVMQRMPGEQFWDAERTVAELRARRGYEDQDRWPTVLLALRAAGADLAFSALGAALEYLSELKLDTRILTLRNFTALGRPDGGTNGSNGDGGGDENMVLDGQTLRNLDVLRCETTGGLEGSLLGVVDHTQTAFGKRLLARWLCCPPRGIARIEARLDAVDAMNGAAAEAAAELRTILAELPDLERKLARINDSAPAAVAPGMFVETLCAFAKWFKVLVERLQPAFSDCGSSLLASLVTLSDGDSSGGGGGGGLHPDLSGFLEKVGGMLDYDASFAVKDVVPLRMSPDEISSYESDANGSCNRNDGDEDVRASIEYSQHFATITQLGKKMEVTLQRYKKLLRCDKIQWGEPFAADINEGINSSNSGSGGSGGCDNDDNGAATAAAKRRKKGGNSGTNDGKMSKAKKRQIEAFGGRDYLSDKRLLLEVPAKVASSGKIPDDWKLLSENKQRSVFWTPIAEEVGAILAETEDAVRHYEQDLTRRLVEMFAAHAGDWSRAVHCIAQLDCLQSLAAASAALAAPSCRPRIAEARGEPFLEIEEMRHPCLCGKIANFVPNSITLKSIPSTDLGVESSSPVMLLTGPNMGGKSTLLRQVCVCVIMAQLGCYVPAESCSLSPVDRIFTRIGANDNIVAGQSTFMVELQETSSVLTHATKSVNKQTNNTYNEYLLFYFLFCFVLYILYCTKSLVVLDELGRGTSTYDGYAIAYAVLQHLAQNLRCRTLFSTHYHMLTKEFEGKTSLVGLFYMDCMVIPDSEEILFTYHLKKGLCPQSYGLNVAIGAGLPMEVVNRAREVADEFAKESKLAKREKFLEDSYKVKKLLSNIENISFVRDFWKRLQN